MPAKETDTWYLPLPQAEDPVLALRVGLGLPRSVGGEIQYHHFRVGDQLRRLPSVTEPVMVPKSVPCANSELGASENC